MNIRSIVLAVVVVASSASTLATAHGPNGHEPAPAKKPKPTTCEQLADAAKYDGAATDPATRDLKASCEAKKQGAGKK
ncbi:MAG TPA: hypothetical protein DDZ67_13500 [Xanthomonadaceae bacterium]|nr:hypothetical protein [Xanthomonadaceae bacterium]